MPATHEGSNHAYYDTNYMIVWLIILYCYIKMSHSNTEYIMIYVDDIFLSFFLSFNWTLRLDGSAGRWWHIEIKFCQRLWHSFSISRILNAMKNDGPVRLLMAHVNDPLSWDPKRSETQPQNATNIEVIIEWSTVNLSTKRPQTYQPANTVLQTNLTRWTNLTSDRRADWSNRRP